VSGESTRGNETAAPTGAATAAAASAPASARASESAPASASASAPAGVYAGLRVLDLSRVLAGPYCGQFFADFGADVIKVEDLGGDENRRWAPLLDGQSANYLSVNRGKRGMTLDLKSPEGQDILRALVRRSDVVIDSFLPDAAVRLGVDDASLRRINPDVVHVTISGYGDTGPLRGRPGYDLMLQAFTGMMSITGEPDRGPIRAGASVIDMSTGMLAFSGAASALFARQRGAGGQHVKVSLLETGIALLGYHAVDVAATGVQPQRGGSGVWHLVPYQAFPTLDGSILAGATNDDTWRRLCTALGVPALAERPEYRGAHDRIAHRGALIAELEAIFRTRDTDDWIARLDAARVPCSVIHDVPAALAHPQVAATQMMLDVPEPGGPNRRLTGVPIKLDVTPATPGAAPPRLGQHTTEILMQELGYDPQRIEALRTRSVI